MGIFQQIGQLFAGRPRLEPKRDTQVYARLMALGGQNYMKDRPLVKPTPTNIRRFAKTPYARRAINRIKNPIAMLEWEVVPIHGVETNPEIERQIEIVKGCLTSPNYDDSFRTFSEQLVEDLLTAGSATYEQQVGNDEARPLWMWPVDALSIEVYAGWDGKAKSPRYMQVLGYGNVGGVQGRPLLNDELVYIRKDPTTDSPFGWGPLEIAFQSINRLLSTSNFAGDLSSNAQPAQMIWFEGMDTATLTAFRNYWRNEIEGQGQTPIQSGPAGSKAEVLTLRSTGDDALFLKWQEFLIREIAVAFEISPMTLGLQQDVNRNTGETLEDMDWDNTIIPMARNIQSYLNRQTIQSLLGFSQIEFKYVGLDREDEAATSKIYETYYRANLITPNEQREKLGLPPSDRPFADMLCADVEIAIKGAQGAQQIAPNLVSKE